MEPVVLKFPAGMDNRAREYALSDGAARTVDNLDVTRDGGLISRLGTRSVFSGNCHSFFSHPNQQFSVFVKDAVLQRLNLDGTLTELVAMPRFVQYAVLNNQIYWTNGESVGVIDENGDAQSWGLPVPPPPLAVAALSGGLLAGAYTVAIAARRPDGAESPVSDPVSLDVALGGGIEVTTPTATGVEFIVYCSQQNGPATQMRQAAVLPPATTAVVGAAPLGKVVESLYASAPIPGQYLVSYKGRLWVASKNVLWFTSEYSPHWIFPQFGFYQFETPILALGVSESGLYVGLESRVYFLQGNNPYEMTQRSVSVTGVVAGTAIEIPYDLFLGEGSFPSQQCAFVDRDGMLCIGKPGGIIVRPTQALYSAGAARAGTLAYREHEGLRQFVFSGTAQTVPRQSSIIAITQIFPNGVVLGA